MYLFLVWYLAQLLGVKLGQFSFNNFLYFRKVLKSQNYCEDSTEFLNTPDLVSPFFTSSISMVHFSHLMKQYQYSYLKNTLFLSKVHTSFRYLQLSPNVHFLFQNTLQDNTLHLVYICRLFLGCGSCSNFLFVCFK